MAAGKDNHTCIEITHHPTPLASAVLYSWYAVSFAEIFLSSNLAREIVFAGHSATQIPQPWQANLEMTGLLSLVQSMAPWGQQR